MQRVVEALIAAARSVAGRVIAVSAALVMVGYILHGIGPGVVAGTVAAAARWFPLVVLLDGLQIFATMSSLRALYGDARHKVPLRQLARAGLIGYAIMGLVPAGRAVAEVARAALLARWVGSAHAAAGAARMQAVALVVNSAVSAAACAAVYAYTGPSVIALAIAGNGLVTLIGGTGLLLAGRHSRVGAWLGRRMPKANEFGLDLDEVLANEPLLPGRAIAWEVLSRVFQVTQNGVLVVAVGGALGVGPALASEGIHLVGTAIGELVPAQLGFIEANYTFSARALGLAPAAAVSIALLAHVSQLFWVLVGSVVPLVWPAAPRMEGEADPALRGGQP